MRGILYVRVDLCPKCANLGATSSGRPAPTEPELLHLDLRAVVTQYSRQSDQKYTVTDISATVSIEWLRLVDLLTRGFKCPIEAP